MATIKQQFTKTSRKAGFPIPGTPEAFRALCKNFKFALENKRKIKVPISDIQEGLAIAYGYEGYQHYLGIMNKQLSRLTSEAQFKNWPRFLLCVEGEIDPLGIDSMETMDLYVINFSALSEEADLNSDKSEDVRPSYLEQALSRTRVGKMLAHSVIETEDCVITAYVTRASSVDRYGLPSMCDSSTAPQDLLNMFSQYKVYEHAEAIVCDKGDDSTNTEFIEIAVPPALAKKMMGAMMDPGEWEENQ